MADIFDFKPKPGPLQSTDDAGDITRACPFCGERENLSLGEMEQGFAEGPEKTFVPAVFCESCDATAPLKAWNGLLEPSGAA